MKKKDFTNNGILDQFLSEETQPEAAQGFTIPKGYKLIRESKSERMQLLVRPTTKEAIKKAAEAQGVSVNDFVNQLFEEYLERMSAE